LKLLSRACQRHHFIYAYTVVNIGHGPTVVQVLFKKFDSLLLQIDLHLHRLELLVAVLDMLLEGSSYFVCEFG
jgi:hypothetical protein